MAKKDDRSNNVERLQNMVRNTEENIHEAEATLTNDSLSEDERQKIRDKNKRRNESINAFKEEISDEHSDRERGKV